MPDEKLTNTTTGSDTPAKPKSRRSIPRFSILIRRLHLYAGLFLLPWVFLYGITGAMYNHQGLFPEAEFWSVGAEQLADSGLDGFPSATELASEVVREMQASAPEVDFALAQNHGAEFNNNVILELRGQDGKHAVHIDPVAKSATVVKHPEKTESPVPLIPSVKNLKLGDDPYKLAKQAVPEIMESAGLSGSGSVHPIGWCKLNFLASVDGQLARVTYVLRDGHVDVTKYDGNDGMSTREFFMRLHTSHGRPPHWNARALWSIILDTMAIAMVSWGVTGLIMWWQLKRTRLIGGVVIAVSIVAATSLYFSMSYFYATTQL